MGTIFNLKHANIMAYLTSRSSAPPRIRIGDITEFLEAFMYEPHRYLMSEPRYELWSEQVSNIARTAFEKLEQSESFSRFAHGRPEREGIVPSGLLEEALGGLRSEFSSFPVYALAVGSGQPLRDVARDLATQPLNGNLLVLIPDEPQSERNFNVLDPVPAFSVGLHAAGDWPGFVLWTLNGVCTFAKMESVGDLIKEFRRHTLDLRSTRGPFPDFASLRFFDEILREWERRRKTSSRRLLHLSDLHFGKREATENQPLLEAELRDVIKTVHRVVITGDLIDSPDGVFTSQYGGFRNNLTYLSGGKEPITITGNHDQRLRGILGGNYEQVARIGPNRVEVEDECEMIFICFNSSEDGALARGEISDSQFRSLGAEYRNLLAARPQLRRYLPIVLVHHHPFSFVAEPEGWLEQVMDKFGVNLEPTLALNHAEKLHQWCVDWDIKTILHGHKHKARYVERSVRGGAGGEGVLTAIGCGSSLGAEGSPVSYNLLEWEPTCQKWVASFHQSVNGGAFKELAVSVSA